MPVLRNPRQERFAQETVNGKNLEEAHRLAGYTGNRSAAWALKQKTHILERITEIASERAAIHQQAMGKAVQSVALEKEWVISKLIDNVERAMQIKEVVIDGNRTGMCVYNGAVANKALELLGREIGMFVERHEVGGPGDFARLTEAELLERAINEAKAVGAGEAEIAAIRRMFGPKPKMIEAQADESNK